MRTRLIAAFAALPLVALGSFQASAGWDCDRGARYYGSAYSSYYAPPAYYQPAPVVRYAYRPRVWATPPVAYYAPPVYYSSPSYYGGGWGGWGWRGGGIGIGIGF